MGEFLDRVMGFVVTFAGPADWRSERDGRCDTFSGRFLIYDRRGMVRLFVRGRIVQRDLRTAEVYLYDPPTFVSKHRHGRCMQLLRPDDKWFKLHFEKPATDFAEAYTYVEHLLTEAYNLTH
jgi:hypothetical protein